MDKTPWYSINADSFLVTEKKRKRKEKKCEKMPNTEPTYSNIVVI
jgi:hypothetical protein